MLDMVNQFYADSIDIDAYSEKIFVEMLQMLDPFSTYFTAEQMKAMQESNYGKMEGIGVSYMIIDDTVTITSIIDKSPADSIGFLVGDQILFLDGQSAINMDSRDVYNHINGEEGETVSVIIKRNHGNNLLEYNITKKLVDLPSITAHFMLPGSDIGIVQFQRFSHQSYKEFQVATDDLDRKGMEKMILDLRGNAGGYINSAVEIIDEFIAGDRNIAHLNARNPAYDYEYDTKIDGKYEDMPLIVLVDHKSASACEVIAGAVQDYARGLIIGELTYGKGLIQRYWTMNDSTGFRLTIGNYTTPLGRSPQKPYPLEGPNSLDSTFRIHTDENTFTTLNRIWQPSDSSKSLPVYENEDGRKLFGNNGIMPDKYIIGDTLSILNQYLKNRGIYLIFSMSFVEGQREELIEKYDNDPAKFWKEFKLTDEIVRNFIVLANARNTWNHEMFNNDKTAILTELKATIAHCLWLNIGYNLNKIGIDKSLGYSAKVFPQIDEILNNKAKK